MSKNEYSSYLKLIQKLLVTLLLGISSTSMAQTVKTLADLPQNLIWQTNTTDPIFASQNAKKGGIFRAYIDDFPPTFRKVGPNANSSFVGYLRANDLSLVGLHPQTGNYIPELATHWAISKDNKTAYFKLNPKVKWSDGNAVTADDYLFTLTFMRSPHIVAPWYNNHYTQEISDISKYDDYTISVTLAHAKPTEDVLLNANLSPKPKHFHKLDENWVKNTNWKPVPTTGPYIIKNFKKGRYIDFGKVDSWWGENEIYFKHRFNVDTVRIKVIRNLNIAWNMFLKGQLDSFPIILPEYWHERANAPEFKKGYIHKYWFYNETPQPTYGLYLNLSHPLFKDKKVRYAVAHALNIDKMIQALLRGDYDRLPSFNTGLGDYSNHNLTPKEFNIQKATSLLEQAGWQQVGDDGIREKNGQRLSFKVNYSQPIHTPRLALLKEEMRKAGIEMELQLLTGASSYKNLMEKKHQAAWMAWGAGIRPAYWQHFHSDNAHKPQTNNITNTDDQTMDTLIDAYKIATSKAERVKLAHEIQSKIAEIGAFIPTYMVPYTREAAWAYIKLPNNIAPKQASSLFSPMGLGTLWIDKTLKSNLKSSQSLTPTTIIHDQYRVSKSKP